MKCDECKNFEPVIDVWRVYNLGVIWFNQKDHYFKHDGFEFWDIYHGDRRIGAIKQGDIHIMTPGEVKCV